MYIPPNRQCGASFSPFSLRIDELQPVLRFPGRAFEPGTAEAGGRRFGNGGETRVSGSRRTPAELDGRASRVTLLCDGEIRSQGPTAGILNNAALLEESGLV